MHCCPVVQHQGGVGFDYYVYQAKSFFSHGHLNVIQFFLRSAPTSWGRDMLCCSFMTRCQKSGKSLDGISAEATQVVRCWLVPKKNILQLYPISLQLAIVQSALNTSLCMVCLSFIANCVSGQPCAGHCYFIVT